MTAATLTLTEFLLARIAEDEAAARAAIHEQDPGRWEVGRDSAGQYLEVLGQFRRDYLVPSPPEPLGGDWYQVACWEWESSDDDLPVTVAEHIAHHDPARVLAECEAKRRIADLHSGFHVCVTADHPIAGETDEVAYNDGPACPTLCILAAVYADHPDYREEWRP